jgi:F-type H+-transporting ATPase subunit delta
MRNTRVAHRYSKALIDSALETNQLEQVKAEIDAIRKIDSRELRQVMLSPIINHEKKVEIFKEVFSKVSPLTTSFFNLIFVKGREWVLPDILDAFEEQYKKLKGIEIIELTTAVPVSDELRNEIKQIFQKLERFKDKTLVVNSKVDESIVGGFIAQSGDTLYDASIRYNLHLIQKQFVENLYVQKLR